MELDMCVYLFKTNKDNNMNTVLSDKLFNFLDLKQVIKKIQGPALVFFEYTVDSNKKTMQNKLMQQLKQMIYINTFYDKV